MKTINRELPTKTRDWLRSLDHKKLISELKTAPNITRSANLKLALAVGCRAKLGPTQPVDPAAKLKWDHLTKHIAELEIAKIEADDHWEYLRSILRQSRAICNGLDYEIVRVLDFASSNPLTEPMKEAQTIVRRCIDELMQYGIKLSEIEKEARPASSPKPLAARELMSLPRVQFLNKSFDTPGIRAAHEKIRHELFGFSSVTIGPPRFFSYSMDIVSGDNAARQMVEFLRICERVDPRCWARCRECGDYFLRRRANIKTQSCSDECRYEYNNRREDRMKQKVEASKKYGKGGEKYRG